MRLRVIVICLLLLVSCTEEPGSFSFRISWEGKPPQGVFWVWSRVEKRTDPTMPGPILSSAEPTRLAAGERDHLDVSLANVPYGSNRVAIVEVRQEENPGLRVLYYGISQPFSLSPSEHVNVDVLRPLAAPAADRHKHQFPVKLLFGGVSKQTVNEADIRSATVQTRSIGAVSVALSTDESFSDLTVLSLNDAAHLSCTKEADAADSELVWDVCEHAGWDLLGGLPAHQVGDGPRWIYARFIDVYGYASATHGTSVVLDTQGPLVRTSSLLKFSNEGNVQLLLTVSLDEATGGGEDDAVLVVMPETPTMPRFAGPYRTGESPLYEWEASVAKTVVENDSNVYTFSAQFRDALGNRSDLQPLVDSEGNPIEYTGGCDCASAGRCCDGCYYKSPSTVCQENAGVEYGCPWGTASGNDVGMRYRDQTCSGSSVFCEGFGPWKEWQVADDCSSDEACVEGVPTCRGCDSHSYTGCSDGDAYWYSSCGLREEKVLAAPAGHVCIPAGTFTMGSPESENCRHEDETQHEVTLTRAFFLKTTEVTQSEFEAEMGYNPSYFQNCGGYCPVELVSWHEALYYCNQLSQKEGLDECFDCSGTRPDVTCDPKAAYASIYDCPGYRLPTEAEWEYAARAGTTTAYYSGTKNEVWGGCEPDPNLDVIGWYCGNSRVSYPGCVDFHDELGCRGTHPVGAKQPNGWGLYDMSGNVYEWCWDWYDSYPTGSVTDPIGAPTGSSRVCRGGCWAETSKYSRSADRNMSDPDTPRETDGFRPARTILP